MIDPQELAFKRLFSAACKKCFGYTLTTSLSETDARALSNAILQRTGLLLGIKTLKNYSIYVVEPGARKENPSVATLDTLARYVLDAPSINEVTRKNTEPHHPYWFQYKGTNAVPEADDALPSAAVRTPERPVLPHPASSKSSYSAVFALIALGIVGVIAIIIWRSAPGVRPFKDNFNSLSADSLARAGWEVQRPDAKWWKKRDVRPGYLTLYTLIGDNWPGSDTIVPIQNLLVRHLESACFSVEVQFKDLRTTHNWQQAGILLAEDPTFSNRVLRLSFSYNNFFGGYSKEPEIIIQGLSSVASSQFSKPEEFAHIPILTLENGTDSLVWNNLRNAALKIEKKGQSFRFLFSTGATEAFAFKEAVHGEFEFQPMYVGLFAMQGRASEVHVAPIFVDLFTVTEMPCDE